MTTPTLTREELADITGYKRGRDQFKYLERLGWRVTWNEAGLFRILSV